MIANAIFHVLSHPDALSTLRADPTLVPAAGEEALRLEPDGSAGQGDLVIVPAAGEWDLSKRQSILIDARNPGRETMTLRGRVPSFALSSGARAPQPDNRGAPWASQRFPTLISTPRC